MSRENVWATAVHRVAAEGISPEQAVDEAIARIKQILAGYGTSRLVRLLSPRLYCWRRKPQPRRLAAGRDIATRKRGKSQGSGGMSRFLRMANTETPWRIGR